MAARKSDGVRRSARILGTKANPIDLTKAVPATPKNRVTKSKKAPRRDCGTCGRTLAASSFPKQITENCDHDVNTCKACVKAWIPAQLDGNTYDKLSCPECPSILQNEDVKKQAAKAVYERFDDLERRGIAETVPGWRWCMNPKCRAGQVHQPLLEPSSNGGGKGGKAKGKKRKRDEDDICECEECGARACVPCDRPYHEGETCAAFQKKLQKVRKDETATLKTIDKECKKCPGCSKNIQKNGGCDQMICTQCRTSFCFLCVTDYKTINKQGHAKTCIYAKPGRYDPHANVVFNNAAVPVGNVAGGNNQGGGFFQAGYNMFFGN